MSGKVVTITYGGKNKKRLAIKDDNWGKYYQDIGKVIKEKVKLSLDTDCHMVVDDNVIRSSSALGDALSQISGKKIMLEIKDGPGPQDGIKTILINEKDGKKVEWYFNSGNRSDESIFDEFQRFAKQSFGLSKDGSIAAFQIDNESDNKEDGMELESGEDLVLCYNDLDSDAVVYIVISGDSGAPAFDITVDLNEADVKEDLNVCLPVASTDEEWLKLYSELQCKIGEAIKNAKWEQSYVLYDTEGTDLLEIEDFTLAFGDLDVENGSNKIKFVLKAKDETMCTIEVDIGAANVKEKSISMKMKKVDIDNETEVLSEYEELLTQIGSALNDSKWNSRFVLKDGEGTPIESLEDFMLCVQEKESDQEVLSLTLEVSTSIDPNAPRLFLFEYEGNTLSWKPDFDKDKQKWSMHFAKAKRGIRKQFKSVNLTATPATYSSENVIVTDDIKNYNNGVLTKDNIKNYWEKLKDSNKSTMMKFVIGGGAAPTKASAAKVDEITVKTVKKSDDSKYDDIKQAEENPLIVARRQEVELRMAQQASLEKESLRLLQLTERRMLESLTNYKMAHCSEERAIQQALRETNERWKMVEPALNVVESLKGSSTAITIKNEALLTGFQGSLMSVMKTRWDIQSSLLIVRSIMTLNPGNEDAKEWGTIIDTCQQIYDMARAALKSSLEVAGGLLLFHDALSKVQGREKEELKIVLHPLKQSMKKLNKIVTNSNKVCSNFETRIVECVTTLEKSIPGSSAEFKTMRANIKKIEKEKERMIKEKNNIKEPRLQKAENEFNVVLNQCIPPESGLVVKWYIQREAEKNGEKIAKKDIITIEDLKTKVKQNEVDIQKKYDGEKKTILEKKSDEIIKKDVVKVLEFEYKEITSRTDGLRDDKKRLIEQRTLFETMKKSGKDSKEHELADLRKALKEKISKLGTKVFDDSKHREGLRKSMDEIERLGKAAANATNSYEESYTVTHHRTRSSTTGALWWKRTRTWQEPYYETRYRTVYTWNKDNLEAAKKTRRNET